MDDTPLPDTPPPRLMGTTQKTVGPNLRYSRFIRRARLALPLLALAILTVVLTWNILDTQKNKIADTIKTPAPGSGRNELVNPHFESQDDQGQPYTLTATKAIQDSGKNAPITLIEPNGSLHQNDGSILTLTAATGDFHQDTQQVTLRQDVVLTYNTDYILRTAALDIDMASGSASNDIPVAVTGPQGTIDAANGLRANTKDNIVIFQGPAKLILTKGLEHNPIKDLTQ